MTETWEAAFAARKMMWGLAPARSAVRAAERFERDRVTRILLPGVGYGRNARPFLDAGMAVTGIEIAATAIELARSELGLTMPIHHGSVTDMPFDDGEYDGVFCHGLLYLLDAGARAKLLADCHRQLAVGGTMVFAVIAKDAPMYGQGRRLGDDWYETHPGVQIYFYDSTSIAREFAPFGLVDESKVDEPHGNGASLPFLEIVCRKR